MVSDDLDILQTSKGIELVALTNGSVILRRPGKVKKKLYNKLLM